MPRDLQSWWAHDGGILAIPAPGGPHATLPPGRHLATFDEIYELFVEQAPFKDERELIYDALRLYAKVVDQEFSDVTLWINGGFITHKSWAAPKDADVVVVVPMSDYANMCSNTDCLRYLTLQGVMVGYPQTSAPVSRVQPMAGLIDSFVVPDDPAQLAVWDLTWSTVTDQNKNVVAAVKKGYLEVKL